MLSACTEWWRMTDDDVILQLEQEKCNIRLSKWLIINLSTKEDLLHANSIVKTLGKVWLRQKKYLIPPILHCRNLLVTDFVNLDLSGWKKAGICILKDLLVKGHIPESDYFQLRIHNYNVLQHYQARSVVTSLQKSKQWRHSYPNLRAYLSLA